MQSIRAWHERLPAREIRNLTDQLKALEKIESITVATACSGTDILVTAFDQLIKFWSEEFGRELNMRHIFSCESAMDVQKFLLSTYPMMEALIPDTSHLGETWAPTKLRGPPVLEIRQVTHDLPHEFPSASPFHV